mmetsp:Transcript_28465/g.28811  ORF Transcript_28465/g.28811 Transcript_28465/m.28811 type:complete len:94 (+) Transcript_28465:565-846(+)
MATYDVHRSNIQFCFSKAMPLVTENALKKADTGQYFPTLFPKPSYLFALVACDWKMMSGPSPPCQDVKLSYLSGVNTKGSINLIRRCNVSGIR